MPSAMVTTPRTVHLCVLIHGLWGNPGHLKFLSTTLRDRYSEDELHILLPKTNSGNFTYDGIEVGAERVTKEIEDEISLLRENDIIVDRLSVVGYSLGGIIGRFTVGLLYHKGYFEKITPMTFTTFATPHLGVRTPLNGLHNHVWNVLGARTLSVTGRQLFLVDKFRDTGRPLLSVICDPDSVFIKGLALFKTRSLYSNIVNDRSAVYYTTCIAQTDPFVNLNSININYLPSYAPVLIDIKNPVTLKPNTPASNSWIQSDLKTVYSRVKLGLFFAIFIPIGSVLFLTNAAIQTIRSSQRIRAHASGGTTKSYEVPLLYHRVRETVEGIRERVDEAFERVNARHKNEYLENSTAADHALDAEDPAHEDMTVEVDTFTKVGKMEFPTLALALSQFTMIQSLDDLGWKKYPVHINQARHSHAAIIVRMNRESFSEGKLVIKHFVDGFEV